MNIGKVLCVVDANQGSRQSARAGVQLARQLDADLILVDTLQTPFVALSFGGELGYFPPATTAALAEHTADDVESALSSLASEIRERDGIDVRAELLRGAPADRVVEYAREHHAGLIVVHRDDSTLLDRVFARGESDLARDAHCPVIYFAGPPLRGPIRHALVGVNFSEHSDDVLNAASALVGMSGRVTLVHAWDQGDTLADESVEPGLSRDLHRRAQQQKSRALFDLVSADTTPLPRVDFYVDVGDPVSVLMRRAKALDVDALFVGAHSPSGLGERLFGTTTDKLIAASSLPIMVVPEPEPEPEDEPGN